MARRFQYHFQVMTRGKLEESKAGAGRRAKMPIFHLLSMAAFSLVSALSGVVGLLLTLSLVKAAVTARSFESFEGRLRNYTDSLVVTPDGTISIIKNPHPVLLVLAWWMAAIVIFIAAVYMLRRIARGRLMYGGPVSSP